MATNGALGRKLRMGIVGGGQGSFIGRVHVTAAVLDNRAALVAGALSSDPERSKASAADYDIDLSRAYGSYQEMFDRERALPSDKRIDFVGGARGTRELEALVQSGQAAVAFALFPVTVGDLIAISDAGGIMPPKSTWFEPKLRDGLLVHQI